MQNIVFRDGEAAAFVDFDFAGPADPIWDVAIAAQHAVPIGDPSDIFPLSPELDARARLRLFTDAYGLSERLRPRLIAAMTFYLTRGYAGFTARADAGVPGFAELRAAGFGDQFIRARQWLDANGATCNR